MIGRGWVGIWRDIDHSRMMHELDAAFWSGFNMGWDIALHTQNENPDLRDPESERE